MFASALLFARSASVLLVTSVLVNVLNYVFSIVMGRMLTPVAFGEMNALFGALAIIGVVGTAAMTHATQHVASLGGHNHLHANALGVRDTAILLGVLMLVCMCALPYGATLLGLPAVYLGVVVLLSLIAIVSSVYAGVAYGEKRFVLHGSLSLAATSIKLVVGCALVYIGYSVAGVLWALVLAGVISLGAYARTVSFPRQGFLGTYSFWWTLGSLTLLAIITSGDALVSKALLSGDAAGMYAALSTAGKMVLFAGGFLPPLIVPYAAAAKTRRDHAVPLVLAGGLLVGITVCAVTLAYPLGGFVMRTLFGETYVFLAPLLPLYFLGAGLLAVASLLTNYIIGVKKWYHIPSLVLGIVAYGCAVAYAHPVTLTSLMYAYVVGTGTAVACLLCATTWTLKHTPQ